MSILALIVLFFATMIVGSIMNGWALSVLWEWFIVPFGAPSIGIAHAIGVSIILSYITYQSDATVESQKSNGDKLAGALIVAITRPLLVLFIGWIVHSFMVG